MYSIYLNSEGQGLGLNEFKDKMLQICTDHQNTGEALAFAFLIYDFTNPNLWKILNDREYWMALSEISGNYLTIFSLNYRDNQKTKKPISSSKRMELITMIDTSISLKDATRILKEKYFDCSDFSFPSILFFQVEDNQVTGSLAIELKEEKIEEGFIEIKRYIEEAVSTLKKVSNDDYIDSHKIFELLSKNLEKLKTRNKIIGITRNFGNIVNLISNITSIF